MLCVVITILLNTYSGRISILDKNILHLKVLCDLFITETNVSGVKVIPNVIMYT